MSLKAAEVKKREEEERPPGDKTQSTKSLTQGTNTANNTQFNL